MKTKTEQATRGAVASTDWLDEFYRDNAPMDAGARRAHFERTKQYNAFHDGADTPEIKAAIARARIKALKAIKAKNERK